MNTLLDPTMVLRHNRWEELQADASQRRRQRELAADSRSYPRHRLRRRPVN
jgi:hypothetical protein